MRWAELYHGVTEATGRSAKIDSPKIRGMIEAAGFTDLKEEVFKVYINPWSTNPRDNNIGKWFNLALAHSSFSLIMKPLVEKFGWDMADIKALQSAIQDEAQQLTNHTYCTM